MKREREGAGFREALSFLKYIDHKRRDTFLIRFDVKYFFINIIENQKGTRNQKLH